MRRFAHGKPTVCQVLHTLHVGGAEVLAARLVRRLQDRFRFVFACLDEIGTLGEELHREGFPVDVLGRQSGRDWRCAARLRRLWNREHVDVVHAHQYTPFFYSMIARLFRSGPPIMFTEHGRHQPDYPRRKRKLANRLLLRRSDRLVAVGEAVRQALIDNEGLPSGRIRVIYNGIDVERFRPAPQRRDEVRRELELESNAFVILQVARLDYLKDHPTAIRMMARLRDQVPQAVLLLAGDGPEEGRIREQVADLGVKEQVRFLGLRSDVDRLLSVADVFLLTSVSEGIPLTVIEAMAAGLPVVGTDVGGMGEVVLPDETGWLCPAGDDEALARRLAMLAESSETRKRMGLAGRERTQHTFDEVRMAQAYQDTLQEMANG